MRSWLGLKGAAMFRFNPDDHAYFLGDRRLESVTEVLKDVGLTNHHGTEFDLQRGSVVHEICRLRLAGTLDETSVDPYLGGYLGAFEDFLSSHNLDIDEWVSEVPSYHPTYLYGGTPDVVGVFNGRRCLIDIKSGCIGTSTAFQTAAYASLPSVGPIDDRFGLQLKADGKYNLVPYRDRSDFDVWWAALTIYRAKRR